MFWFFLIFFIPLTHFFWSDFIFNFPCFAATKLACQIHQERAQVVCSNNKARKRLTESNGTFAMDLGHTNVVVK